MIDLPKIVSLVENDRELHASRLLVLLLAFNTEADRDYIEGLTKLAKLDFLLRYPAYFEKALLRRGASRRSIAIEAYESQSVEASMVRYRFGPWDHRYREYLNYLSAKGLIAIHPEGGTIRIALTACGRDIALDVAKDPAFATLFKRASALKAHLDIGAKRLMEFIYETFPEIGSLNLDQAIVP